MMADGIETPGFADPVGEAQATFRAVLDAMARPGRIAQAGAGLRPPTPMIAATAAVALTLIDQETRVFLDPAMQQAAPWLAFHAGAPIAATQAEADFVLALSCPDIATLPSGSDEAPEDSATLILQVAAIGSGAAYRLTGPGLAEPCVLQVQGLPADFADQWRRNHALAPRGIDIVLCAENQIAALPRSVTLEAA
jgi:alpha-D-ribose 1-methylphosphonate 5-triphosphate synthase subunit PhnH